MILSTIDPPSAGDRLVAYYAARARVDGFHPSDVAARAARGLSILRRIAWIERRKKKAHGAAHAHMAHGGWMVSISTPLQRDPCKWQALIERSGMSARANTNRQWEQKKCQAEFTW